MMPQPPVSTQRNLSLLVICSFSDRLLVITAPGVGTGDVGQAGDQFGWEPDEEAMMR